MKLSKYVTFRFAFLLTLSFTFFLQPKITAQQDLFQKIQSMGNMVSADSLSHHIKMLEKAGGHYSRVNLTPGNDSAAAYIKNYLSALHGLSSVEIDTFYISSAQSPYDKKPLTNIIATIEGKKTGYYIYGAHYDCSASRMGSSTWNANWKTIKSPGADDNATGVAVILEMARVLSDTSFHFEPEYGIKLVAFGAEESGPAYSSGHQGSLHYAELLNKSNTIVKGMTSVDMIGYNASYNYNSIVADINSQWLGDKFNLANETFKIGLKLDKPPYQSATYSDHASFWQYGYSAVLLIENAPPWNDAPYYFKNPFYHTSSDSFGTVNMELVGKMAQLTVTAAAAMAAPLLSTGVSQYVDYPDDFMLFQNYPNPFNPVTTIEYIIPKASFVNLKIYDALGSEVKSLVSEVKPAGNYSVTFGSGNLSSGIYFYSLQAGGYGSVKKMILMK